MPKNEEKKLTSRQWRLYELLRFHPDRWWTQEEICQAVEGYHYSDNPKTHNHCPSIYSDRTIINASGRVDKIIVMKNNKFKIATLEEYRKERAEHIKKLKNQIEIIKNMDFKFSQDGQCKLFNNILEELTDDNEQYHDTFLRG